jgi:signal transduction histidine kinase
MKQTLLGLEDRIVESGLILREGYPVEPVKLMLDGGRMHCVFENLVINMVKYALPGTRAYIDIIVGAQHINIILRNISAHELNVNINDLAERFVRGDAARNTEGFGLGLAIAKSFVELQGGTFEIVVDGDLFKVIMTFNKAF